VAGVKIRDAVEDDLSAIVEIYNSTVPSHMVTADPEPVSV
jgi:phosphinothricin acetyltransferase